MTTRADKANLFATLGPDRDGGFVLSGHTDVVPVDGQDWSSDPFNAEIRGGKLYGRGACDMKGFIGTALALLPEFSRADLKRPLHFAFSFDEEVGCVGVRRLLDDLKTRRHQACARDHRRADKHAGRRRAQGGRCDRNRGQRPRRSFERARDAAPTR